jgi:hypothetical protein
LAFIGAASLSDDEFETVTIEDQLYLQATYDQLELILDSREAVSAMRDRLKYYFLAKGTEVTQSSTGKSNVFLGDAL